MRPGIWFDEELDTVTTIPDTRYARNGDTHIAYQSFGRGETVFVGAPPIISNIEVLWEEPCARQFLTRLASFCRFVHYDKRGQGMSDRDVGVPTLEERVDDLRAVLDAEGIERAALGGISEGGSTVAMFAATYPQRVSRLVLVAAPLRITAAPDFPVGGDAAYVEAFFREWAAHWGTPETYTVAMAAPSKLGDDEFLRWMNRYERQSTSPGGLMAAYHWISQIDIRPILPAIDVPTLVLHRSGDRMVPVAHGELAAALIPDARLVILDGEDHMPWYGNQDEVLDLIEEFLTGSPPSQRPAERVLATVLFTDIVGSTEQASTLGDKGWRELLDRHDQVSRSVVETHQGRVVKSTGDGLLATFDGPGRALRGALDLRDRLTADGITIRAGLHTGEIELRGDDVGGIAVHIAARVEATAEAGEVLASRTVRDLVAGSGIVFEDRGTHALKGIADHWQLYAIVSG